MSRELLFRRYRSTFYGSVQPSDEIAFGAFRLNYLPLLPQEHKAAILDLGCGSGTFLRYLASEGFHNVIGLEGSKENVGLRFSEADREGDDEEGQKDPFQEPLPSNHEYRRCLVPKLPSTIWV